MRRATLLAALAIFASAALAACGSRNTDPNTSTPITFAATTPVPTTTVPTPTNTPYPGPDVVPVETGQFLAPATTTALGRIVDGIQCNIIQQLAYRTYAHLQVYVDGKPRALPGGIGMVDPAPTLTGEGLYFSARTCYYWLHTRVADGVIEAESPNSRRFTLADFFAVWNQPLNRDRVATAHGRVSVIIDGHRYRGNPRAIRLRQHEQIELAVGKPVPRYHPIDWIGTPF